MRSRWLWYAVKLLVYATVAVAAVGAIVMLLWNALLPALFGWPAIGFWQAVGLLVLSKILLGGFGRWGHGSHWRHRMWERWDRMSDEERARFREGLRHGCGRARSGSNPQV